MRLCCVIVACVTSACGLRLQNATVPASFEDLKKSVVRITTYTTEWHWGRPYDSHTVSGSTGSGFFISMDPPTFATCAHVVENADSVYVQIPEAGLTKYPASVVTICNDADVAIVQLDDHESVMETLKNAGVSIQPLVMAEKTPSLGSDVVATGFPLGQMTLKLSTGVVSGVDHVEFHYTNLALQSTAIISEGNSGSPLLDQETKEVIGVNYAKNPEEAQINYAVPLWRLQQVVAKHKQVVNDPNVTKPYQYKVVSHGLVLTPGLDAFYLRTAGASKSCRAGPLISNIDDRSPFMAARPPVKRDSFLVSVDGVKLDRFGQGEKSGYVDELVNFDDLFWMRNGTGEEDVDFEICDSSTGEIRKHTVNMAWSEKLQGRGVQYVYEPRNEKVEWEIFEDLLFMELTENHIELMSGEYHSWALVRYLDPKERSKPHLAVMLHREGGDAEDALYLGEGSLAIVESINGHPVSSLTDFRAAFAPEAFQGSRNSTLDTSESVLGGKSPSSASQVNFDHERAVLNSGQDSLWSVRTTVGNEYAVLFAETLRKQVQQARASPESAYLMTSSPLDSAAKLRLMPLDLIQKGRSQLYRRPLGGSLPPAANAKLSAGPLLVKKRVGSVSIVDFPKGEGYMEE